MWQLDIDIGAAIQALAGLGLGDLIDQAVNAQAAWVKSEKGALMQQALQIRSAFSLISSTLKR